MKSVIKYLQLFSLVFLIAGCSDNATSPTDEQPPSMPDVLIYAGVDLSFFDENNLPLEEDYQAYHETRAVAVTGNAILYPETASALAGFLVYAQLYGDEPIFENGSWVWNMNIPTGSAGKNESNTNRINQSLSGEYGVRIVASPVNDGVEWALFLTGTYGGSQLNNRRILVGFVASDNSRGYWHFYPLEGSSANIPQTTYEWISDSEQSQTITVTIFDENGDPVGYAESKRDEPENWIEYEVESHQAKGYWNETSGSGWVEQDGIRACFQNFKNAPC